MFGGGGGVIVAGEIKELHDYGVAHIYSPEDGRKLGLQGMIGDDARSAADQDLSGYAPKSLDALRDGDLIKRWRALAQLITVLENGVAEPKLREAMHKAADTAKIPVLGITGTGGAGKSSLTDELVRRFRLDMDDELSIAVVAIDPTRRKTGGALLGDRIRMNAINPWSKGPKVFMRSLATRDAGSEISAGAARRASPRAKVAGFDLVIVETSGIGQGDAAIVPHVDVSMYVMTPEYGAASQLEKIDMLDFADFVAINKFDRKGAQDALRDVSKQVQRNKQAFGKRPDEMLVFGTQAARFNDDGVTALYHALLKHLREHGLQIQGYDKRGGKLPLVVHAALAPTRRRSCRRTARATWRRSPRPCAATSSARSSRRVSPASASNCSRPRTCWPRRPGAMTRRIGRMPAAAATTACWSDRRTRGRTRVEPRPAARRSSSTCGRRCSRPTAATSTW